MRSKVAFALAASLLGAASHVACSEFTSSVDANGDGGVTDGAIDSPRSVVGCGTGYATCDDFERPDPGGGIFSWTVGPDEGGFLSISTLQFRSGTRSMKVVATPAVVDGGAAGRAYLRRALVPSDRRFRLGFSVLPETEGPRVQLAFPQTRRTTIEQILRGRPRCETAYGLSRMYFCTFLLCSA